MEADINIFENGVKAQFSSCQPCISLFHFGMLQHQFHSQMPTMPGQECLQMEETPPGLNPIAVPIS